MNTLPMPLSAAELVEEWTGQMELFERAFLDLGVVQGAREHVHTGKIVGKDHEAAARIVALASMGWSERRIADHVKHSRNTVRAVLRLAEKSGKVEPLKDRVLAAAANAVHADIELGNDLADKVRAGVDSAPGLGELASFRKSSWVGAGILADKQGPAPGPATINVQVNVGQVVAEYAGRLKRLADSESGVPTTEPQEIQGESVVVCPVVCPPASLEGEGGGAAAGGGEGRAIGIPGEVS